MVRRLGLIYRKDKALSKAALGFIQVVLDHVGDETARPRRKAASAAGGRVMTCKRCRKGFEEDARAARTAASRIRKTPACSRLPRC